MSNFPFNVGDRVEVKRELLYETGFITFIDSQYFTLCVKQWEDKDALHGVGQCNLCIYRQDWQYTKKI